MESLFIYFFLGFCYPCVFFYHLPIVELKRCFLKKKENSVRICVLLGWISFAYFVNCFMFLFKYRILLPLYLFCKGCWVKLLTLMFDWNFFFFFRFHVSFFLMNLVVFVTHKDLCLWNLVYGCIFCHDYQLATESLLYYMFAMTISFWRC